MRFMKRKVIWTIIILVLVDLWSVYEGYGIRLKSAPCTHLTGLGISINYVTKDCERFHWYRAIP